MKCPCYSGLDYEVCCEPYHQKRAYPQTALLLMRSRYSAYALKEADYIMDTTHPENPEYSADRIRWRIAILQFCQMTQFTGLEILEIKEGKKRELYYFFCSFISA